uniref:Tumor necrosis factor receptor superfamily, member 1a n=1 Tax=Amphiprion ocellaris TaxID=80972 RepID=A0AAQ5Z7E0_AMPOC
MEAAGLRRRRNKKAPIGTFLLLMSLFLPASCLLEEVKKQPTCPHGDYLTEEGICCNKCSPGFKLVEKCHAVGQRSNCTACPADQFTDQMNFTPNCRRCRRCKQKNEEVAAPCERHQNTVCRCKKGFYRFRIDSETSECRRCSTCRPDEQQEHPCSQDENTVCGCKENFYRGTRGVCEACKKFCCSDSYLASLVSSPVPELIYSVLDLVPVLQVKQLVRCLGVKDSEIEQADLDHRSCREAHYQMLRVWAERGSRAAGGGRALLLPLPLLQELIDKLRLMHLGRAAEELETKYCIQ